MAFFLFGCIYFQPEPAHQYLCSDGLTVVSDLNDCPYVDAELKECEDASSTASYGASEADVCYYELAMDRENASLCKKIRNTDDWYDPTAAKCAAEIAMYTDDVTVCEELSFLSKYDCYFELAVQSEDYTICGQITSSNKRDECYADLADELYDYTICSYISSSSTKDDCLYDYVSWNSYYIDDWSICDLFSTSADWEQDYCYQKAAERTGQLSYCDKITSSSGGGYYYSYYTKPDCYGKVAKGKRQPSICEQLTDSDDKDDCYYEYATSYPYDVSTCNNIVDTYTKEDCIDYANYSYYY